MASRAKARVTEIDITRWTGCPRPAWDYLHDRWACGCRPTVHGYDDHGWLFIAQWDPGRVLYSAETT